MQLEQKTSENRNFMRGSFDESSTDSSNNNINPEIIPKQSNDRNETILNSSNNLTRSQLSELITMENHDYTSETRLANLKLSFALHDKNAKKKTPAEQVSCALKSQDYAIDEIDKKKKSSIVKKSSGLN